MIVKLPALSSRVTPEEYENFQRKMEEYENEMSEWEEESPEIRRLRQAEMPKKPVIKDENEYTDVWFNFKEIAIKEIIEDFDKSINANVLLVSITYITSNENIIITLKMDMKEFKKILEDLEYKFYEPR